MILLENSPLKDFLSARQKSIGVDRSGINSGTSAVHLGLHRRTMPGMAKIILTAPKIAAFTCPPEKDQAFIWCAKTPGLGLRTTPRGRPAFFFKGSIQGASFRTTIGDAAVWSIQEAQAKAREMQRQLDEGHDPRKVKAAAAALVAAKADGELANGLMVGVVWAEYLATGKPKKKESWKPGYLLSLHEMSAPGGKEKIRGSGLTLPGPIFPLLSLRMRDVTPNVLRAWHAKEAVRGPAQAARAVQIISGFLSWCATKDEYENLIDTGAARHPKVQAALPSAKGARRTDALERGHLHAFFEGLDCLENRTAAAYLTALLLTGARREELAALTWSNVDFRWRKLTIADKVNDVRILPLAPYLEHLLKSLPRVGDFVFASSRGVGHLVDARKALAAVLRHAEIEHLTPHGLRRSFSLLGEAAGAPDGAVSQIMGHSPGTMSEHYRPRTLDGLRESMARIERFIVEQAGVEFDFDTAVTAARTPLRRVV